MFQPSFLFQHKFQRKATHFVPALSMAVAYAVAGWLALRCRRAVEFMISSIPLVVSSHTVHDHIPPSLWLQPPC